MRRKKLAAVFFAALTVLSFAASAGAVDGTIEINQAKVNAAGGFPYTISNAGSYRLTGDLTVSSTSADAIDVKAGQVSIDLNGFSITGPGSSSLGTGISGYVETSLAVEDGVVSGFSTGIAVGENSIVKSVRADANINGISTNSNAVIQGCTANRNTQTGIEGSDGTVISGNTVNFNQAGIFCAGSGCLVSGNTIDHNSSLGLNFFDATSAYGGNVLNGNNGGGASINNGTSIGAKNTNLCNGTAC